MRKIFRGSLMLILLSAACFHAAAQNVAINNDGSTGHPSSILDVKSTDKGMLIPRMSKSQRDAIGSPATGLLIFQQTPDSIGFYYYSGTKWIWLTDASNADTSAWKINGNSNITGANFLGTTNDSALRFRIRNLPSGIIDSATFTANFGYRAGAAATPAATNTVAIGNLALQNNRLGFSNIAIGSSALIMNDTSIRSVVIGTSAGYYNKQNGQVAVGYQAGTYNNYVTSNPTEGLENTALGYQANRSNVRGNKNTAVGYRALYAGQGNFLFSVSRNTAVGDSALAYTVGDQNTGIGNAALGIGYNSNANVAIGDSAMAKALNTDFNVAVGARALRQSTAVLPNTAVGYSSQDSATTGVSNTSLGANTLTANKTGSYNTAVGNAAMSESFNAGGGYPYNNTALGNDALRRNRYFGETSVGGGALRNDSAGFYNTAVGYLSQYERLRGSNNTSLGVSALRSDTASVQNTAIGLSAMFSHRAGDNNVALGAFSFSEGSTGAFNTALGLNALRKGRTDRQTAVGADALYNDTAGVFNVAVGNAALSNGGAAKYNTAVGTSALLYTNAISNNAELGKSNTAVGFEAGAYSTQGSHNSALGYHAFRGDFVYTNGVGNRNVAIGDSALAANVYGTGNVAVGATALGRFYNNSYNTAIGDSAMALAIGSGQNEAFGANALKALKTNNSYWNAALGGQSMELDSVAYANVAVGFRSLRNIKKAIENTAVGVGSMEMGDSSYQNTAVGRYAMFNTGNSSENTAIGYNAMSSRREGYYNNAMGSYAMQSDSAGIGNTGLGVSALRLNKKSYDNVAVGLNAGFSVIGTGITGRNTYIGNYSGAGSSGGSTGINNTGLGISSLNGNNSGNDNTALGAYALISNNNGTGNVAVGENTMITNTSGSQNTIVGYRGDVAAGNLFNSTAIGSNAYAAQNNSVVLGSINGVNSAAATTNTGIGVNTPAARLHVRNNGASGGAAIAGAAMIVEDNANSYFQFLHPAANETGILSLNPSGIRSGIIFANDNSVILRAGGNTNRFSINSGGFAGLNRTPVPGASSGVMQVTNISSGDDQLGIYNNAGNHWTYFMGTSAAPTLNLYYNGTLKGTWDNASGAYTAVSDRRFKKDIGEFGYGLDAVKALTPYRYHYLDAQANAPYQVGFMAQDLLKIFPEAVKTNTDKEGKEFYTVDYQTITVLSVKAIKDQQAIIDKQQKTIDELLKRMDKLEQK